MRAPVTTYRIQLRPDFPLEALADVVEYLSALGISDCYCSPILAARAGSTHGYDILDHSRLNPELGTIDELRALAARLRERDMGLLLDFVPNHMGIDPGGNRWWRDVLAKGPGSEYATYFDIDWQPVKRELREKVLLPILGDQYGIVLERGELTLAFEATGLVVRYFDRVLPINPEDVATVLGEPLDTLRERLAPEDFAEHVRASLAVYNGRPGEPGTFDRLHELLEQQAYRLAYWRTAFDEINYRRFFDVNELAGLRQEDPRVFRDTHALLLQLVEERLVTGLRIDHPDGLFDPQAYFRALQDAASARLQGGQIYIVAEKILARGERLREDWPVHGTTGYNSLNMLNGVFVHPDGLADLRRMYRRFTGRREGPADTVYVSKKFMMRTAMASELNVLSRALSRLAESERSARDFTLNGLRRALVEVIACFPVYRTYVTGDGARPEDAAVVDIAIAEARRRNPVQEPSILEFVRSAVLPASPGGGGDDRSRQQRVAFAQRFQQYTAPVVAKGLEDTAFYRDVLLLSSNEVGGEPRHRSRSTTEFHADNWHRLTTWPLELTAAATHDTKRGEDARARINVISELVEEWRAHLSRWGSMNDSARVRLHGLYAPDRNDEWMFYQALAGAWPAEPFDAPVPASAPAEFVERMQAFMGKAIKEAKRQTSWLHTNAEYEQAVARFIQSVLTGEEAETFLPAFLPFQRRLAWFGMLGSLSQLVLRIGAPGVPDIYQGTELWNLSLVDPDNRRAVDYGQRRAYLEELRPVIEAVERARTDAAAVDPSVAAALAELFEHWHDGRVKMYTLAVAMRLRRGHPDLFLSGEYQPLGSDLDDPHLVAFSRKTDAAEAIVIAPRFFATLLRGATRAPFGMQRWRTTSVRLPERLAGAQLLNVFTGELVEPVVYRGVPWLLAGSAFQSWPAAIFWRR